MAFRHIKKNEKKTQENKGNRNASIFILLLSAFTRKQCYRSQFLSEKGKKITVSNGSTGQREKAPAAGVPCAVPDQSSH